VLSSIFVHFVEKMGRNDLDFLSFCVVMNNVGILSDTATSQPHVTASELVGVSPSGFFQMFQPQYDKHGVITADDFVEGFLKIRVCIHIYCVYTKREREREKYSG
jgi:hypothetical protein